ncbi:MAG: hypothetical protein ACRDV8_13420, partial [Acidimicrobiales bacterium]
LDIGLADDVHERLLGSPAGLEERGQVGAREVAGLMNPKPLVEVVPKSTPGRRLDRGALLCPATPLTLSRAKAAQEAVRVMPAVRGALLPEI